ncbi:hypothetical protein TPHA_0O00610 [Tetrapisispora phaffii CBS 4417]|uniref:Protein SYM1 n=1 Tax=Tetrapisispora phaffii (strain ATCC 24235 / CBS 4417 / NBRC 1672 / NRRL Y-8282 / UCD 70-5) TaxID=1071381 RepID=G8C1K3_TETPH|nr:hypothetical protein TPHA_0O00610 [Tetrapisispora phaffii CBS 4417]CCE66031.1 hypothetical protein TPHA_0O00610 [Tetrapisispora phaffii CBS 4417]
MLNTFFTFYRNSINKRPVLTNSLTTGFLFATGDVLAQKLFPNSRSSGTEISSKATRYDYRRTLNSIIYGSVIFSPIGLRWYQLLSKIKTNYKILNFSAIKSFENKFKINIKNTILRVGVDQLLFAPLSIPFYFICMSVLEHPTNKIPVHVPEIKEKLNKLWLSTLLTNWKIWPFFQLINFSIIPLQFRLLTVNFMAIFWNTYLSYTNNYRTPIAKKPVYYPPLNE